MAISKHSNTTERRRKVAPTQPQEVFTLTMPQLPETAGRLAFQVVTDVLSSNSGSWLDVRKGDTVVVQVDAEPVAGDCVLGLENVSNLSLVLLECKMMNGALGFYLMGSGKAIDAARFAVLAPVVEVRRHAPRAVREAGLSDVLSARIGAVAVRLGVKAAELMPREHRDVVRDVAKEISSYRGDGEENPADYTSKQRWLSSTTQVNLDFAVAALCEAEDDVSPDGNAGDFAFFDLSYSAEYQKLRNLFIADATGTSPEEAFQLAVWRSYNAGRYSPVRLAPRTRQERQEERDATRERKEHVDRLVAMRQAGEIGDTGADHASA